MPLLWTDDRGLIMQDKSTKLALSCALCPCIEWRIAGVCYRSHPCTGPVQEYCKIDGMTIHETAYPNQVDISIAEGTRLGIIRYTVFPAPFDGTATFQTFINGASSGQTVIEMEEGVNVEYSTDYFDDDVLGAGAYRIDIRCALYDPSTGITTQAPHTAGLLVYDVGSPVLFGNIVVPSTMIAQHDNVYLDSPGQTQCLSQELALAGGRGPFSSKKDAEYVLDTWDEIIAVYTRTCLCNYACGVGDDAGYAFWGPSYHGSINNLLDYSDPIGPCEYPMTWRILWDKSGTDTVRLESVDGPVLWTAGAGGSGDDTITVPRCTPVRFWVEGGNGGGFGVNVYSTTADEVLCAFDDPTSPWYGKEYLLGYDPETHEGVPSTSAELADYLASLEV